MKNPNKITDMDYEKAYKEALERARDLHDNHPLGQPQTWTTCEKIFPELRESEDERIRKEIIQSIKDNMCVIHKDKCLSWLEKQGEQHSWSEEDEYQINTILHGLDLKRELYKKEGNQVEEKRYKTQYDWLKSLKPNHWKPSEEQMETEIHKNAYHLNKRFNEDQKVYYVWYNPSLGKFLVIDHYYRENYDKYNIMLCASYEEAKVFAFCMNSKLSFEIQERKLRLCQFETLPKEE